MQQLNDTKHFRIRACATPYIFFGLLFVFPVFAVLICLKRSEFIWDMFWLSSIVVGIIGFTFLWLSRFEVIIEGDAIFYSTLFSPKRGLSLRDISTARLEGGLSARGSGFFRLVVEPYPYTGKDPIEINLTVFSRGGLKHVFDFLSSKMPDTKMKAARDT